MNCSAIEAGRPCSVPAALNTPYCGFHILRSINHPMVQDSPEGEFFGLYPQLPDESGASHVPVTDVLSDVLVTRSDVPTRAPDAEEISWPPPEFADPIPDHVAAAALVSGSPFPVGPAPAPSPRRRCTGTTNAGFPCPLPPRKGQDYCLNHEPGVDTRARSEKAARASAVARLREKPSTMFNGNAITLSDKVSIRSLLDVVIRLQLAGRLPDRTAANILRACAVASRTLDKEPPGTTSDDRWRDHHNYRVGVEYLLDEVDPLLAEAQGEHLHWTEVVRRTRTLKSLDDVEMRYLHTELQPPATFPPRTNELSEP